MGVPHKSASIMAEDRIENAFGLTIGSWRGLVSRDSTGWLFGGRPVRQSPDARAGASRYGLGIVLEASLCKGVCVSAGRAWRVKPSPRISSCPWLLCALGRSPNMRTARGKAEAKGWRRQFSIQRKVVLVTGGTGGMGLGWRMRLAAAGADLAMAP